MHFHDVGSLIWVVILLIGVVSSIRRSLGRNRRDGAPSQAEQAQAAQQQEAARRAALAQQLQAQLDDQQRARTQAVQQQRATAARPAPARAVAAVSGPLPAHSGIPVEPPPMHVYEEPRLRLAGTFATLFEKRSSMIRAIVAAEVLGSPKSLAEQSIWSPRYTER